jgi:hypothetical protein
MQGTSRPLNAARWPDLDGGASVKDRLPKPSRGRRPWSASPDLCGKAPGPGAGLVIVSGGQTGVDRAALDAALAHGLAVAGWCPKGRRAEDGPLPPRYPLRETPSPQYAQRTRRNVRDSDATLVLYRRRIAGGTALAVDAARALRRPLALADLSRAPAPQAIAHWIARRGGCVLNVAGPRESQSPGIYSAARRFFEAVLCALAGARASGSVPPSGKSSPASAP